MVRESAKQLQLLLWFPGGLKIHGIFYRQGNLPGYEREKRYILVGISGRILAAKGQSRIVPTLGKMKLWNFNHQLSDIREWRPSEPRCGLALWGVSSDRSLLRTSYREIPRSSFWLGMTILNRIVTLAGGRLCGSKSGGST
jgi:hypothetical protein